MDGRPHAAGGDIGGGVWAVFAQDPRGGAWTLASVSAVSEARARGLAERAARDGRPRPGTLPRHLVLRYATPRDVPWTLDGPPGEMA